MTSFFLMYCLIKCVSVIKVYLKCMLYVVENIYTGWQWKVTRGHIHYEQCILLCSLALEDILVC